MSASALTPLAMSALAMLVERPMHPYEMYRLMVDRYAHEVVKVKPGTLYHAMARMADAELIEAAGTDREGGRPERTTYRITPKGVRTMQERLRGLLAQPVNEYPSFPAALGEAHNLPREEVLELLATRIATLQARVDESRPPLAAAAARGVPEAYLIDHHFVVDMTAAELEWLRELVARIENKELEWPSRP
ncbi:PadR family transcriptional regulator [Pseudonocardia lacus]|uniref:PadR family transcriptional regulator n=1 Tax=Pseudonocardia lacus TaxID=2835865 RepID=UPI0027E26CC3|nr:PadR family transcriptional regulator [Pseudonocardia lacus]